MTALVGAADIERALEAWSAFPIHAAHRPIIMIGSIVLGPPGGFRTTALKEAFCAADYLPPPQLPPASPRSRGYAIVDAPAALARLTAVGDGQGSPGPLHITSVELGTASFATDRGHRELPAWLFSFERVTHPAAVLALGSEELFPQPGPLPHLSARYGGRPGPDDLTLEVYFIGTWHATSYAGEAVEAGHAIAIQVEQLSSDPPPNRSRPRVVQALPGHMRTVTVQLDEPVGDRVLIDPYTWGPAAYLTEA